MQRELKGETFTQLMIPFQIMILAHPNASITVTYLIMNKTSFLYINAIIEQEMYDTLIHGYAELPLSIITRRNFISQ